MKRKKKQPSPTLDVLSYFLIPEMKILSGAERTKLLSKYGVDEGRFPKMLAKDPAAKALDAKPGDIVRITRDDGTGKYHAYKIIV
ncbi:DNA-directed RNA polymerase subunit H [Candidatus Micrarchaeota archaeon]|nr:DNA-directed RNA polymerase subunit H [Candidatus Micrarchaeota archaeon]